MSWTDPDVKNHVNSQDSLNISLFTDKFVITNDNEFITNDKKIKQLKNNSYTSITMYHPSLEKLEDAIITYKGNFISENKNINLMYSPMKKSHNEYSRVDFYQILLAVNRLWSMMEFEKSNDNEGIVFPSNYVLTKIFSNVFTEKSNYTMKSITSEIDIAELNEVVNNAITAEYSVADLVSEKIYMKVSDVEKMFKSPIIKKYLSKELNRYSTGNENASDEVLNNVLINVLNIIKTYQFNNE